MDRGIKIGIVLGVISALTITGVVIYSNYSDKSKRKGKTDVLKVTVAGVDYSKRKVVLDFYVNDKKITSANFYWEASKVGKGIYTAFDNNGVKVGAISVQNGLILDVTLDGAPQITKLINFANKTVKDYNFGDKLPELYSQVTNVMESIRI